ncbi:MAG: RDD family protein, partial [Verrucomicrobiota bacterium]
MFCRTHTRRPLRKNLARNPPRVQYGRLMAHWYFTANDGTQVGPVEPAEIRAASERGDVLGASLVWREELPQWVPFHTVAADLYEPGEDGTPVEIGVCAHSDRVYQRSDMVEYGDALIGLEHKDAFVQSLMESGETDLSDATEGVLIYVGFWWRVLSSTIDYMVKLIPTYICFIPYYVAAFAGGGIEAQASEDMLLPGFTVAMAISYVVGLILVTAISIFYETWMTGKYGGTLGKMAIGAVVVKPDGVRLSYKQSFIRWLVKKPL